MTPTIPSPDKARHTATAPIWLTQWAGRLALFTGFVLAFLLIFSGAVPQGLLVGGLTFIVVPLLSLLAALIWRFFWYVVTGLLILQLAVLIGGWWGVTMGMIRLPRNAEALTALINKGHPFGIMLGIVLAGLLAASVWQVYSLWQMGGFRSLRDRLVGRQGGALFNFDIPGTSSSSLATTPLGERVLTHLNQMGHRGEMQGDLIHVYNRRDFVGIVRVVESAGAISPVIVRDVEKQRTKLGVKVAYLATAGWFTDDVRQIADQMGVRLITV